MSYINKNLIKQYLEKFIVLMLLYKMITLIIYGGQQYSSNYIERFVWEGLIYLGISIFFLFKLNIRNIFIYIPTAAFWAVGYLWLLKTGYKVNSPDLWNLYIRKILALSTLIPVATDALFKKRFANFRELNWVKIALFGLFFIGMIFIPNGMGGVSILLPFLIYSLISFEKERIDNFLLCFTVSNILAVAVLSLKSLITHPYAGEPRYYGSFTNLHSFGMFVGSGIIACLFLYFYGYVQKWNRYILIFAVTPFLLFDLYVFFLINSRNALLGVIVAAIALGWLFSVAKNKRKLFIGVILSVFIVGILAIGIVVFFGLNYEKYSDFLHNVPQFEYFVDKYGRLDKPMVSQTNIFPVDSIWNQIDYLSNHRLSVWKVTIDQLKWFSGNSTLIVVTDEWSTNTHNTYLGYLNGFGIVLGSIFIVLLIYSFISAIIKIKSDHKNALNIRYQEAFTILWYAYAFTLYMNEMRYLPDFYVLIPLLLMSFLFKNHAANSNKHTSR